MTCSGEPGDRTADPRSRSSAAVALASVIAASVVAGLIVYARLVVAGPLPQWDEASHLLHGARIAHDLREGDLTALAIDTYFQVWWPPMHSWLVGSAFLLTGPTTEAGRAVSVLSYVLLAPVLFLVARLLEPRHGAAAGTLAAALALTSPLIITFSALAMLEVPGLLAVSLAMLVYCVLEKARGASPRAYTLLGLAILLAYLIKTHYGILLVITLLLARLFSVRFRVRGLWTRENLFTVLPLALFCLVWFAWPVKIIWTWNALVNHPSVGAIDPGPVGLLFFPRALFRVAGPWWLTVLLWAGLAMAWRIRSRPGVSFVALLPLVLFVIGELHHTKAGRHILPMLPPMFVLTGVAGARLRASLRARGRGKTALALTVLASIALVYVAAVGSGQERIVPHRDVEDALDFVSAQATAHGPALVLGVRMVDPSPPTLDWHLVTRGVLPINAAGAFIDPARDRWFRKRVRPTGDFERLRASVRRALYRYDRYPTTRSLQVGDPSMADPSKYEALLATTIRVNPPRTVIAVIPSDEATPYGEEFVAGGLLRAGYRRVSVREFPHAGTRIYVYDPPIEGAD